MSNEWQASCCPDSCRVHKSPPAGQAVCMAIFITCLSPTKRRLPSPLSLSASSSKAFPFSIKAARAFAQETAVGSSPSAFFCLIRCETSYQCTVSQSPLWANGETKDLQLKVNLKERSTDFTHEDPFDVWGALFRLWEWLYSVCQVWENDSSLISDWGQTAYVKNYN